MEIGQTIYFYFDAMIPCMKGRIKEITDCGYKITWLNRENKPAGSSSVSARLVFSTREECEDYIQSVEDEKKSSLRKSLTTKKSVLEYLYCSIYSEYSDLDSEKEVLKEKIKELFDVTIDD